jgi:hypothetical protein
MRIIRASEVTSYLYCQRSWFYRLKGITPANQRELLAGTQMHYQHGRMVAGAWLLRVLAFVLVLGAILIVLKGLVP